MLFRMISSRFALPGRMCRPSRVSGETRLTSQHSASPSCVAPYATKSRRRRPSGSTPGTGVRTSHCCGTTWPSVRAAAAAGAHLTNAGWEGRPMWSAIHDGPMRPAQCDLPEPGERLAASRFSRLFNPFSRHRVAAGPCAARAGAAAFAVWAARCRMARHRPQRGRRNNAARPHAYRFAAVAPAAARRTRQMWAQRAQDAGPASSSANYRMALRRDRHLVFKPRSTSHAEHLAVGMGQTCLLMRGHPARWKISWRRHDL